MLTEDQDDDDNYASLTTAINWWTADDDDDDNVCRPLIMDRRLQTWQWWWWRRLWWWWLCGWIGVGLSWNCLQNACYVKPRNEDMSFDMSWHVSNILWHMMTLSQNTSGDIVVSGRHVATCLKKFPTTAYDHGHYYGLMVAIIIFMGLQWQCWSWRLVASLLQGRLLCCSNSCPRGFSVWDSYLALRRWAALFLWLFVPSK